MLLMDASGGGVVEGGSRAFGISFAVERAAETVGESVGGSCELGVAFAVVALASS